MVVIALLSLSVFITDLPKGQVLESVTCLATPDQSYALYVPSNYDPKHSWPIIFALDPMKRGSLPVKGFAAAAEKWGYLVMGSNTSHNYDWSSTTHAVNAMVQDAYRRFNIDSKRIYHAGFSGGARASCDLAMMARKAAGVIAFGAAFSRTRPPDSTVPFSFVGVIGNWDMNFLELNNLDRHMDQLKLPHKILEFDGGHHWPTYDKPFTEALAWIELEAYRYKLKQDHNGIQTLYQGALQRAAAHEEAGHSFKAWQLYSGIVQDFKSFLTPKEAQKKRDTLGKQQTVKHRKRKRTSIAKTERKLVRLYSERMDDLRTFDVKSQDTEAEKAWWRRTIEKAPQSSEDVDEDLYYRRMLVFLRNGTWEVSMVALTENNLELAIFAGEIAIIVGPKHLGAHYHLAKAYAAASQPDAALNILETARTLGMGDVSRITQDPHFKSLEQHQRFQKLIKNLKENSL